MHYKSPDNSLHFLDDDSFVHLLPAGSVAITDEEAEALRPFPVVDAKAEAQAYLNQTDFYVIRNSETGKPIPPDVLAKRAAAREIL